jgi:hypothetical protein
LVKGTAKQGSAWSAQLSVTLDELEAVQVLENMHIFGNVVAPKDMYPRFEYANLANLLQFYEGFSKASQTLRDIHGQGHAAGLRVQRGTAKQTQNTL